MKKIYKILFTLCLMVIGIIGVDAKTLENTCTYDVTGVLEKKNGLPTKYECQFFDSSGKKSVSCKITLYNKSAKSNTLENKSDVLKQYKTQKSCPKYIIFELTKPKNVYAYWTLEDVNKKKDEINTANFGQNLSIIVPEKSSKGDSTSESYINEIKSWNEYLENFNVEGYCSMYSEAECSAKVRSFYSTIDEYNEKVNAYVTRGDVDRNNSEVKKFYSLYSSAKEKMEEYYENYTKKDDVENDSEVVDRNYLNGCTDLGETLTLLKQIYTFLRYMIPVLIIVLSIVDFIKVVASGDDKNYKTAYNRFIKRIIVGFVILLLPFILSLLIRISGIAIDTGIDTSSYKTLFCIFE